MYFEKDIRQFKNKINNFPHWLRMGFTSCGRNNGIFNEAFRKYHIQPKMYACEKN